MFHVVQILLHRPFVSNGHLQEVLPDVAFESFSRCAAAANWIALYLEAYNRIHTFQFAPFFLFYASYVSATIHVRIAAQRHLTSDAFESLQTCLSVFDQNKSNNPAVKKAKAVIHKMMDRMGVKPPTKECQVPTSTSKSKGNARPSASKRSKTGKEKKVENLVTPVSTPQMALPEGCNINDLDFDAILQSFSRPDPGAGGLPIDDASLGLTPQALGNTWSAPDSQLASADKFAYVNQFGGGGNMDDGLFGFDVSSREDEW